MQCVFVFRAVAFGHCCMVHACIVYVQGQTMGYEVLFKVEGCVRDMKY